MDIVQFFAVSRNLKQMPRLIKKHRRKMRRCSTQSINFDSVNESLKIHGAGDTDRQWVAPDADRSGPDSV